MKVNGFIKEHDKNSTFSIPFKQYSITSLGGYEFEADLILKYLEEGAVVVSMLHWVNDFETNIPIGPHIIRTDGEWLWPDYITHYIKMGHH
ncbi:MAG: hypothetical protein GC192_17120 [Bacteroidetes bacterium]|nr:hypothetical protein [Bacteroidota bacterium]